MELISPGRNEDFFADARSTVGRSGRRDRHMRDVMDLRMSLVSPSR